MEIPGVCSLKSEALFERWAGRQRLVGVTRIPRKMIAIVNREEGRGGEREEGVGKTLLNNETKYETMVTLAKGAPVSAGSTGNARLNHIRVSGGFDRRIERAMGIFNEERNVVGRKVGRIVIIRYFGQRGGGGEAGGRGKGFDIAAGRDIGAIITHKTFPYLQRAGSSVNR